MPRRFLVFLSSFLALGFSVRCDPANRTVSAEISPVVNCAFGESSCIKAEETDFVANLTEKSRQLTKFEEIVNGSASGKSKDEVSARGKYGKNKGYGKLMMYAFGAVKFVMLYIMVHVVAAITGKALMVAKVALIMSTALALKRVFEKNDKVSYEIVKHPYHSYVKTHSSSVDYEHQGDENQHNYHGEGGHYRRRRQIIRCKTNC